MNYSINSFMCPLCGKNTIPLARSCSKQHARHHRKWLYCPWCQKQVNTYECRNETELSEFNEQFASGEISKHYHEELETMNIECKRRHKI